MQKLQFSSFHEQFTVIKDGHMPRMATLSLSNACLEKKSSFSISFFSSGETFFLLLRDHYARLSIRLTTKRDFGAATEDLRNKFFSCSRENMHACLVWQNYGRL